MYRGGGGAGAEVAEAPHGPATALRAVTRIYTGSGEGFPGVNSGAHDVTHYYTRGGVDKAL